MASWFMSFGIVCLGIAFALFIGYWGLALDNHEDWAWGLLIFIVIVVIIGLFTWGVHDTFFIN